MSVIPTNRGAPQASDISVQNALPVIGAVSRTDGQTVLTAFDSAIGSLLDGKQGRFVGGGSIGFNAAGTTLTFSETVDLTYSSAGVWTTVTSTAWTPALAAGGTISFAANGQIAYVTLTKSTGAVTLSTGATTLPAADATKDVYLLAFRRDDTSGTKRVYLSNGNSIYAGGSSSIGGPQTFRDSTFVVQDDADTSKQLNLNLGGSTASTTLTVSTAQTTSQTLSVPNVGAGDSLVTNNTSATLKNKTLDSTDTATGVRMASFTPDGTNTLTAPAATDTLVGRATIDTLSNKTLQNLVAGVTSDSTATGATATLGSGDLGFGIVRLTNASLTGLSGITAAPSGQVLIVENQTGATVNILDNDAGASAANRIRTGTGTLITMSNNTAFIFTYDATAQRWLLAGGSGSGGGGATYTLNQANSFIVGTPVYLNSMTYTAAQANTAATSEVVGLVSLAGSPTFQVTGAGLVSGLTTTNFDEAALPAAGTIVFLSAANPGKLTVTEPSVIGNVSLPVGIMATTTSMYVALKRGVVVGGTNARTQLSLANNSTNNVFNVTNYDAGELTGWVFISSTTSYRFQIKIQFAKNGAGSDYNVSYQSVGDTPPAGFAVGYTSPNITMSMPNVAGFASAIFNYALNAPAVGATFPLSVDGTSITGGLIPAANLPLASSTASGAINYYQQDDTTLASVTWGFSTPTSAFAVKITRIGRLVTLNFPTKSDGTSAGSVTNVSLSINLPTFARPSAQLQFPIFGVSASSGVNTPIDLIINSTGAVQIYFSNGGTIWPNAAGSGIVGTCVTYSV